MWNRKLSKKPVIQTYKNILIVKKDFLQFRSCMCLKKHLEPCRNHKQFLLHLLGETRPCKDAFTFPWKVHPVNSPGFIVALPDASLPQCACTCQRKYRRGTEKSTNFFRPWPPPSPLSKHKHITNKFKIKSQYLVFYCAAPFDSKSDIIR